MGMKRNVTELTGTVGSKAAEVRNGMKGIWLAREIKKEMDDGAAMEEVILRRVPLLDSAYVKEEAERIRMGIQAQRDTDSHSVDLRWVRYRLTDALSELNTQQRVVYLGNLLTAAARVYPSCLQEDQVKELERICNAEEGTNEDVSTLLGIAESCYIQIGELMQRSSVKAMQIYIDKLDHTRIAEYIDSSENAVEAYAAACYILQKSGKPVRMEGELDENMPAFAIGAAAEASVESSWLTELYHAGKITMEELSGKLKNIFTSLVTYVSESVIHALASGLYLLTALEVTRLFIKLFLFLGAEMYFAPFWIIVGAAVLANVLVGVSVSVEDYEDLLNWAWELLQSAWDKISSLWRRDIVVEEAAESVHAAAVEDIAVEAEDIEDTAVEEEEAVENLAEMAEEDEEEDEEEEEDEYEEELKGVFA